MKTTYEVSIETNKGTETHEVASFNSGMLDLTIVARNDFANDLIDRKATLTKVVTCDSCGTITRSVMAEALSDTNKVTLFVICDDHTEETKSGAGLWE